MPYVNGNRSACLNVPQPASLRGPAHLSVKAWATELDDCRIGWAAAAEGPAIGFLMFSIPCTVLVFA
jgi:hypothetical protein